MTLYINGAVTPLESAHSCWGDLVASLDRDLAASNSVLTAVRIDGVDEPAFREPEVCARPLRSIGEIAIETGQPEALARQCLGDAVDGLVGLRAVTDRAARSFQAGDVAAGQSDLEQLSQGLVTILQIVAAAGIALRGELDRVDEAGRSVATLSQSMDRVITQLVAEQQNQDWVQIADLLLFELDPLLSGWQDFLATTAAAA